jgi:RHS repeat-associated protein
VVRRSHPQPDLDLTFLGTGPGTRRAAGSSADRLATLSAGDQYVGLDSFGRVIDQHWKTTGGTTDRFAYTYDRNSNRLTKDNNVNSDFDEAYTYDSLNQLTGFDRNSGDRTQAWDFDALGNWDSLTTDGGSPQTRTHNKQNEITAVSGATTPTFDANGNMTTDETGKQYVYDAWNRLKIVKNSGGTTLKTYVYDALNRRVAETAGGATTDFYYSADWQVLEERDTARTNDTKARYVWSPVYVDAVLLRDRDTADDGTLEERLWVQQDANFNVTALVDNNGEVVERYVYDPYGVATVLDETWSVIGSSAYSWLHLHQGGRLDATSGLYHFRNRDFSPTLGRWATMDPIGYDGGNVDLYCLTSGNPANRIDPLGLEEISFGDSYIGQAYSDALTLAASTIIHEVQHRQRITDGTLVWKLAVEGNRVKFEISFEPDNNCICKSITFIQTVKRRTGKTEVIPLPGEYYSLFRSPNGTRLDHLKRETDPYYGAKRINGKWEEEGGSQIGNGTNGRHAKTSDGPDVPASARSGRGRHTANFETMVVCIEDKKIFGGIKWGFTVGDYSDSKIVITGGGPGDVTLAPSDDWLSAVDTWNGVAAGQNWEQFK